VLAGKYSNKKAGIHVIHILYREKGKRTMDSSKKFHNFSQFRTKLHVKRNRVSNGNTNTNIDSSHTMVCLLPLLIILEVVIIGERSIASFRRQKLFSDLLEQKENCS